ncbi:hypothetical protein AB0N09_42125 [Streptomyces erythrochromogenes]|uniref:hypothetical protein n=1 Tax=Streptomyces erythrochromogenes TaxID=285574 RepID=UPI003427B80E
MDSSRPVYNLTLADAGDRYEVELRNDPTFGGHELIRPGIGDIPERISLCTGTTATCPTRPEQVAAGDVHTCDGLLGKLQGDLFWVACTAVLDEAYDPVVDAALAGMPHRVRLGADPDRFPVLDAADRAALNQLNADHVAHADRWQKHEYIIAGDALFLIPATHGRQGKEYIAAHDFHLGVFTVSDMPDGTVVITFQDLPLEGYDFTMGAVAEFAPTAQVDVPWATDLDSSSDW